MNKFYRYDLVKYGSAENDWGLTGYHIKVNLRELNLHKETDKGYWVGYGELKPGKLRSQSRWIAKQGKKRYAYSTKEEALESFVYRTKRRIRILQSQISDCADGLSFAETLKFNLK
jgi:hypothetical protein